MIEQDVLPFDKECYDKLSIRFNSIFEPKLINEICECGSFKSVKADEVLVDIGMMITQMPFVLSGSIKIMTQDEEGDELLLYYLELGETCAVTLNCCTNKSKSTIRAIAETDTEILFVPVDRMEKWMITYKSWRNYVLSSYNERLNEMVKAIDTIVFNSLEERLKKYIHDKVWIAKSATLNISHQDIANDMYASRVAVSRLMKKLEQDGFIEQQRNKIIVVEYDK